MSVTVEGTATSDTAKIPASQTDYPEYVDLSNLPAAFWSTVKDGGGDIRCYSDASLTTELPREVVSCDTTAETGELHVKHNLSAGDTIYIDVDGSRSGYADSDTFGAENVWASDKELVSHDGSGADSTSNGYTVTGSGGVTAGGATGKLGSATTYDGSDDYFDTDQNIGISGTSARAVSLWFKTATDESSQPGGDAGMYGFPTNSSTNTTFLTQGAGAGCATSVSIAGHYWGNSTCTGQTLSGLGLNTWHHVLLYMDGNGNQEIFINGTPSGTSSFSVNTPTGVLRIGGRQGVAGRWKGEIDEFRVFSSVPSDDYIITEYNNQNSPSTFRTWAEAVSYAISGTVTLNGSPVQGATIRCIRQSDNTAIAQQTTDSNGDYLFTDLEDGEEYHLAVEYEDAPDKYNALSLWDVTPEEVTS